MYPVIKNAQTGNGGHLSDGPLCSIGDVVTVAVLGGKPVSGAEYYLHMANKASKLEQDMYNTERKSPKFYVADGIMQRLRECVGYVMDYQDCDARHKSRRERAMSDRLDQVLDTFVNCKIITNEERVEIRHKFWDLLDKDEEKRLEAAERNASLSNR